MPRSAWRGGSVGVCACVCLSSVLAFPFTFRFVARRWSVRSPAPLRLAPCSSGCVAFLEGLPCVFELSPLLRRTLCSSMQVDAQVACLRPFLRLSVASFGRPLCLSASSRVLCVLSRSFFFRSHEGSGEKTPAEPVALPVAAAQAAVIAFLPLLFFVRPACVPLWICWTVDVLAEETAETRGRRLEMSSFPFSLSPFFASERPRKGRASLRVRSETQTASLTPPRKRDIRDARARAVLRPPRPCEETRQKKIANDLSGS
ncbi:putative transmembrane protein [Toxoplasma gondii p89]|uniref:Putative transmembrane protein n=1 Tax=Toxoplasma gondii p89 TaxID=943119 RepID=A0A086L2J1_TOXGO|nr:putative transmembrane protein [Toxoplasma gondii p89]